MMMMSALVAMLVTISWRWLPAIDITPVERAQPASKPVAAVGKHELTPARMTLTPPPPVQKQTFELPEEALLRSLEKNRAAFAGCWKRALAADPLLEARKVKVRIELDEIGQVVAVSNDATSAKLGNCLSLVARSLQFSAPMKRVVAEFPLFFQPQ